MSARFQATPADLHAKPAAGAPAVIRQGLEVELDELWSVVGKKANRQWVWIALDATTRQVLAFHVGDRSGQSAAALWQRLPAVYQEQAIFSTDQYAVYTEVIPAVRHRAISTLARATTQGERCNCTLGQRVSRLVRSTLSFSQQRTNHIGALTDVLCHDNLTKGGALPEEHAHALSRQ
jgi:insertion element IS1 protein InsB